MFNQHCFESDVSALAAAAENCGLDFLDVDFLICQPEIISFVAAYSLPTRFAHWGFGKRFRKLMLQHRHGLARIHELVCFSEPCQAYLSEQNSRVENMLVAAHVIAHCDFFKNNVNFADSRRDAVKLMAWNNELVQGYVQLYGLDAVEQVLDAALALRYNIDLLDFIARWSKVLEDWEKQVVQMVCEESRYFLPLLKTRLLNEGWAAYWHTRLMQELDLKEHEAVEFAVINAEALDTSPGVLNPYRLGLDMFGDIGRTAGDATLFVIRREESDISFFERYAEEDLIKGLGLGVYSGGRGEFSKLKTEPGEIKTSLLRNLDNCGNPRISVDNEAAHRGMLYLRHNFDGRPLNAFSTRKTLEHVYNLWGDTVSLLTRLQDKEVVLVFNGSSHSTVIN